MSYLLIGLGNPGEKYKETRHNAGRAFVGWLKQVQESTKKYLPADATHQALQAGKNVQEGEFEAVETECFMNESGGWVRRKISNFDPPVGGQISNLIIIHDDLDIPLGKFKIQFGKGPRLHNGVLSVEQALGTKEFWRIRIGIDNRLKNTDSGEDYVLEKFRPEEKKVLELVFPEIRDRLLKKVGPFVAKNVVI